MQVERLQQYLQDQCLAPAGTPNLAPLAGGQSNPTYRLTVGDWRCVLRSKPPGLLLASAHAIDREYRVMQALHPSQVPVPRMLAYCDDETIMGQAFYLMEHVEGRVLVDQSLPGMDAKERGAVYDEMNRIIAALHAVDVAAVGLTNFGKPGNYFQRQISRWTRQSEQSGLPVGPVLRQLMDWLPEHIPPGDETTLVHGDYRLDNLVFHPQEPRVIAVLDWELSTLGHPLADLAYHCMAWHIPSHLWRGVADLDLALLGIPEESAYVRRYSERTGRVFGDHWNFYLAYNLFRMAAILHGIAARAANGNANAPDAVQTGAKAEPLAHIGWRFAQRHMARV